MHAHRIASSAPGPSPAPRWRPPRAAWIVLASAVLHVGALVVAARVAPDEPVRTPTRTVHVLHGRALASGELLLDGESDAVIRDLL